MIKFAITDLKIYVYTFQKKLPYSFSARKDNRFSWPCTASVQTRGTLALPSHPNFCEPLALRSQHIIQPSHPRWEGINKEYDSEVLRKKEHRSKNYTLLPHKVPVGWCRKVTVAAEMITERQGRRRLCMYYMDHSRAGASMFHWKHQWEQQLS